MNNNMKAKVLILLNNIKINMKNFLIPIWITLTHTSKVAIVAIVMVIVYLMWYLISSFTQTLYVAYVEYTNKQDIIQKNNDKTNLILNNNKEIISNQLIIDWLNKKNLSLIACNNKQVMDNHDAAWCDSIITKAEASEIVATWSNSSMELTPYEQKLMNRICEYPESKLCNNLLKFKTYKDIAAEIDAPFGILIWIIWAESKFWTDFAQAKNGVIVHDSTWVCEDSNNWGWIKQKVNTTNGKVLTWFHYPDQHGCYLARFESDEEWFRNLAAIIKFNYMNRWCDKWAQPIRCISWNYVGASWVQENSWIESVAAIAM